MVRCASYRFWAKKLRGKLWVLGHPLLTGTLFANLRKLRPVWPGPGTTADSLHSRGQHSPGLSTHSYTRGLEPSPLDVATKELGTWRQSESPGDYRKRSQRLLGGLHRLSRPWVSSQSSFSSSIYTQGHCPLQPKSQGSSVTR